MKALGMIEVYSFSTAVAAADAAAKASGAAVIAFNRNRPISPDVPAPLVIEINFEGSVSRVEAAVETAREFAEKEGKYIVSHVIANPDDDTEKMAYIIDINRDKYNKKLPKTMKGQKAKDDFSEAFALIEIQGLVAAIEGLDNMLKTANVRLIHTEKRLGGRLVTLIVAGSVSDVTQALERGKAAASVLGKVYGSEVIANPCGEIVKFFDVEKGEVDE